MIKVSVIIPTFNGAQKLPFILNSLGKQTHLAEEVLVVVDGSTDNTYDVLEKHKESTKNLRIIYQENKGRAAVRNKGANEASGHLLVFFDDDMLPLPDCLEKHVAHHLAHPKSILTGGLSEVIDKTSKDILKYRHFLSLKWNEELRTDQNGKLQDGYLFLMAANFSIAKDTFLRLSGFDERLNDAEDFDLAVKAFKSGVPLYFKKDVFAWHNDKITCASYIRRQRQYALAHQKLINIKPWLAEETFMERPSLPKGWRKIIFKLFLHKIWIKAVDKDKFKRLPQKLRYKLYDLVITSNGIYYPEKVPL